MIQLSSLFLLFIYLMEVLNNNKILPLTLKQLKLGTISKGIKCGDPNFIINNTLHKYRVIGKFTKLDKENMTECILNDCTGSFTLDLSHISNLNININEYVEIVFDHRLFVEYIDRITKTNKIVFHYIQSLIAFLNSNNDNDSNIDFSDFTEY